MEPNTEKFYAKLRKLQELTEELLAMKDAVALPDELQPVCKTLQELNSCIADIHGDKDAIPVHHVAIRVTADSEQIEEDMKQLNANLSQYPQFERDDRKSCTCAYCGYPMSARFVGMWNGAFWEKDREIPDQMRDLLETLTKNTAFEHAALAVQVDGESFCIIPRFSREKQTLHSRW